LVKLINFILSDLLCVILYELLVFMLALFFFYLRKGINLKVL